MTTDHSTVDLRNLSSRKLWRKLGRLTDRLWRRSDHLKYVTAAANEFQFGFYDPDRRAYGLEGLQIQVEELRTDPSYQEAHSMLQIARILDEREPIDYGYSEIDD